VSLPGTGAAQVLQVQAENTPSTLLVQLAGGFNAQTNWLVQIQRGDFDSLRTHLVQRQNAAVIYNTAQSDLFVGAHCWMSQQSQLCFDQPIRVNKTRGSASFITRNLDLADFSA